MYRGLYIILHHKLEDKYQYGVSINLFGSKKQMFAFSVDVFYVRASCERFTVNKHGQ